MDLACPACAFTTTLPEGQAPPEGAGDPILPQSLRRYAALLDRVGEPEKAAQVRALIDRVGS